jgi:RNA recognition motif-containing protein
MAKKLYVGSLAWGTTEDGLREAFSQAGTVESAWVKVDRDTGRSAGFGFVEMSSDAEAQAAIDMWNGKELDGRQLVVNEARPQEDRPRSGGFSGSGGGGNRGGGGGYGGGNRGGGGGGNRW